MGHLIGNATPLVSMAVPVLMYQLSHGGVGWWVLKTSIKGLKSHFRRLCQ